ncbi:MAG: hypothetical protein JXB30_11055 [Anaerolineae bacterium]|nr:hypothetical protein [Anaerolineae bacterium]
MKYPVISTEQAWVLARWAAVAILVLVVAALVPPGSLPYPSGSDYSDAAISHWPNTHFLRESVWKYGEWPLWNPLHMLGQPFAANPLSKVWYPPQWLSLPLSPTYHLNVMLYLHMAWLALGMFAWLRAERVRLLTAFLFTVAWGLNPKLIGHLGAGHLDIVYGLAWVPWLLWAVRRVVDTPSMEWGGVAGCVAALLVLADVRIAFYMLPVAAIYAIANSIAKRRSLLCGWKTYSLAMILLLLLTAVQTIPLLAVSPYLTRAALTAQEAAVFSLPPQYLLGMLFPDLGGFHEWMTYLGLPVIGLAVVELFRKRGGWRAWLWWGMAILALLWALGSNGPLFLPVVKLLPLTSWFRVPSRAWFVVVISLVIAGMYGLEGLLKHGLGRRGRLIALAMAFAGIAWTSAALVMPGLQGVITGTGAALFGIGSGLWLAGGGLADLVASLDAPSHMRGRVIGSVLLLVTLILSLLGVDVTLVSARSMADIERPEQEIIAHIDGSCGSVYSPTFDLIGPATARAGLATLHSVDPFQLQTSAWHIAAAAGVELDGYSVIAPPLPPGETDLQEIELDVDLLRTLGVCWIVAEPEIRAEELQSHVQLHDATIIYRLPDEPPAVPQGVYLDVKPSMGVNTIKSKICTETDLSRIVIPQAWMPGWRAWVDGLPVSTAAWSGLLATEGDFPSGCHTVEFAYRPLADVAGMGVTGLTVLGLVVWVVFRRRKQVYHA